MANGSEVTTTATRGATVAVQRGKRETLSEPRWPKPRSPHQTPAGRPPAPLSLRGLLASARVIRSSTFFTDLAVHLPPRTVSIPRS
jgi:hypothetical protein